MGGHLSGRHLGSWLLLSLLGLLLLRLQLQVHARLHGQTIGLVDARVHDGGGSLTPLHAVGHLLLLLLLRWWWDLLWWWDLHLVLQGHLLLVRQLHLEGLRQVLLRGIVHHHVGVGEGDNGGAETHGQGGQAHGWLAMGRSLQQATQCGARRSRGSHLLLG